METAAVILAGGGSTRMGTNKALLRMQPGAPTIIEQVATRLSEAGLPPTLLVTNTPADYAFLGIASVPDDIAGAGALGGILTAITHSGHARCLVVGCDMPSLNPQLLRYMAAIPFDGDALVPRWTDSGGRLCVETLHAIYSTACIEPIRNRIAHGKLKVSAFLEDITVQYIDEPELRRYDPHLQSFRNINTPEEWTAMGDEGIGNRD